MGQKQNRERPTNLNSGERLEIDFRMEPTLPRIAQFIKDLVPPWRLSRNQGLWAVRVTIMLVVILGILTLIGLPFGITLWAWVKLLLVPAIIAAGGIWFNRQQRERELEIADRRAQDEALQAYLDQISQLLTDENRPLHTASRGDSLSTVARARTLTVLPRLDGSHKQSVVKFLYEAGLIGRASTGGSRPKQAIVSLAEADLSGIQLGTNIRRSYRATKKPGWDTFFQQVAETMEQHGTHSGAHMLSGADLSAVDLRHAHLDGTVLIGADLSRAKLGHADLYDADLTDADLTDASLNKANLRRANLSNARGITKEQLEEKTENLEGAIMPDGSQHP